MDAFRGLAVAAALVLAAPATAENGKTPPGNPCGDGPGQGVGNPCNGNPGNSGDQGNKGNKGPVVVPGLEMPAVSGRGAYITQIGDGNRASITQTAPNAYSEITQQGAENEADSEQLGAGTFYQETAQTGDGNDATVRQEGPGQGVVYLTQNGNGNVATATQIAGYGLHSGARLTQLGDGNEMDLLQDGTDNLAELNQEGDDNAMTAVQNGEGNRLIWTQQGSNLSDLHVTQEGGHTQGGQIQITQTGGY